MPKRVAAATSEIEDWTLGKCGAARESIANPSSRTAAQKSDPTVYDHLSTALRTFQLKPSTPDPRPSSPDLQTASELLDHLAAGHETSGIALTYLMHELSLHPEIQDQLRSELLSLSPPLLFHPSEMLSQVQNPHIHANNDPLPSARAIDSLPLLHAILMETLRLHAPIPGPQPRITPSPPASIAHSPPLPPGVRISSQAYTLHRNSSVFPSPLTWNPNRWIDASEAQKAEMGRWFWAFGSGGRMCVGSNFAMQEMKLIVTAMYSNFRTRVVDDGGIEQIDAYTAAPKAKKLVLAFDRL